MRLRVLEEHLGRNPERTAVLADLVGIRDTEIDRTIIIYAVAADGGKMAIRLISEVLAISNLHQGDHRIASINALDHSLFVLTLGVVRAVAVDGLVQVLVQNVTDLIHDASAAHLLVELQISLGERRAFQALKHSKRGCATATRRIGLLLGGSVKRHLLDHGDLTGGGSAKDLVLGRNGTSANTFGSNLARGIHGGDAGVRSAPHDIRVGTVLILADGVQLQRLSAFQIQFRARLGQRESSRVTGHRDLLDVASIDVGSAVGRLNLIPLIQVPVVGCVNNLQNRALRCADNNGILLALAGTQRSVVLSDLNIALAGSKRVQGQHRQEQADEHQDRNDLLHHGNTSISFAIIALVCALISGVVDFLLMQENRRVVTNNGMQLILLLSR